MRSSYAKPWSIPIVSDLLDRPSMLWKPIYKVQMNFFKHKIESGHEMFVLARKPVGVEDASFSSSSRLA